MSNLRHSVLDTESTKKGYKQTEIGVIPEEWEIVKLNKLLELLTDYEANGSFADVKANVTVIESEDYAWYVRATDLEKNTDLKKVKYVDRHSYNFLSKTALYGEELLIAKRGEIGKVYFFKSPNIKATLAPNLYLLKLKKELINAKFLFYYFTSHYGQKTLIRLNASSTLGALYKDDVKNIVLPYPPLSKQNKIVDILSTVDQKIDSIDSKIEETQTLKRGLMQRLLSEGIGHSEFKESEIGRIPMEWEVVQLKDIANIKHGFPFKSSEFVSSETKNVILTPGNVKIGGGFNHKYFRFYSDALFPTEYILKVNDIIISMTDLTPDSNTLGYPFLVPKVDNKNFLHNQRLGKVEVDYDKIDRLFLFYNLCSNRYRQNILASATGTTVKHTSPSRILTEAIPFPPIEEQKQIAETLSTIDEKLESLRAKKEAFETLKKGLIQKLLSGEVRV